MKLNILKGSTDNTQYVFIQDSSSTTGAGLTGLVFGSSGLTCTFARPLTAAASLALVTQTVTGAHDDGGFKEVSSSLLPGVYRLDLSDPIIASGKDSVVVMLKGATNMAPLLLEIQLVSYDPNDAVRLGLTSLPNAAADAAGGLPISDTGGLDLDTILDAAITTRLAPTTAGRTIDLTTGGAAGIDWGNIENKTTVNDLSATDIQLVDTAGNMRGTNSAALASVCTESRLAELDAANLPTDIAAIDTATMRGTDGVDTATMRGTDNAATSTEILTTALTEAYAADGVAPTLSELLFLVQQNLQEFAIVSTTRTVKKLDGTTTAATYTLDDATNPTSITRTT